MQPRIDYQKLSPGGYKAMLGGNFTSIKAVWKKSYFT